MGTFFRGKIKRAISEDCVEGDGESGATKVVLYLPIKDKYSLDDY